MLYQTRAEQQRSALETRLETAQASLVQERSAYLYLVETNKPGAAKRVWTNIEKMESHIAKYRQDLN